MDFEYAHSLGKEDAKARLIALSDYLQNRHGISCAWEGDSGRISGKYMVVRIDGNMKLDEGRVMFTGRDPGMLWRKKATGYIQKKLAIYLDPATPIEELPRR